MICGLMIHRKCQYVLMLLNIYCRNHQDIPYDKFLCHWVVAQTIQSQLASRGEVLERLLLSPMPSQKYTSQRKNAET